MDNMENMEKGESKKDRLEKQLHAKAELFNIHDYLVSPDHVCEKDVVLFQGTPEEKTVRVRYGKLALKEHEDLKGSTHAKAMQILHKMLAVADPAITLKNVENLDSDVATAILQALTGTTTTNPLDAGTSSSTGSSTAPPPKPSGS
jgi:hypothetical protein